jgi:hypothetical protein
MIDPLNITAFNRSDTELEEVLLNMISFAGKNARQQAIKMELFLESTNDSPFVLIRTWYADESLLRRLIDSRIGKYGLLFKAFTALATSGIDLRNCTVEELITFPGIGLKTARFFILHTRPNQSYVVIDTHVLKEMRALGMTELRTTPTGKHYLELEQKYLHYLEGEGITNLAEHDLTTWKKYALKSI